MKAMRTLLLVSIIARTSLGLNLPPFFTKDMNQHTLVENTPVGSAIYTLEGEDPEGSEVIFDLDGTDMFRVDKLSGIVTVAQPIDRESQSGISDNEIRFSVIIRDVVREGMDNVVKVPISVIVLDENDNPPKFRSTPYSSTVNEDTPVGTTIYRGIEAYDVDLVGDILDVSCLPPTENFDLCDYFEIVPRPRDTDIDMFRGSVVLKKPFNYRERQIYNIQLGVFDGRFNDTTDLIFTVMDVQNSPPVFKGSLTGVVNENDAVGTVIMNVNAKDGDTGNPRRIVYRLVENPEGFFDIDSNSGEVRISKPLDREHPTVVASSGVLKLTVEAAELLNGQPGRDESTRSRADVTITIRDVNDEPPTFNQLEYQVTIPENVPYGTPLANLNMEIKDTDTGTNSVFRVELKDPPPGFTIEPQRATGHTAVSLKINKKLDFENPNEQNFILLVVATEEQTEARLSSSATLRVQVTDLNDNHPVFEKESYTSIIPEEATPGTPVLTITAKDRDSGDFGTEGIVYQMTGSGSDKFSVNPKTGVISVQPCPTPGMATCLDYEQTKAYFLSYSATDNNGSGKKSVVNLRITLADDNDNPPEFEAKEYRANIDEGEANFQPSLIVRANDLDETSRLRYKIVDGNIKNLFRIDKLTGEIMVRSEDGLRLDNIPTNRIVLNIEVSDGITKDYATVEIAVRDVNDRVPAFEKTEYVAMVPEDSEVGVIVEQVKATDADYGINAQLTYRIQQGAYDDFAIDATTGEVTLSGKLNFDTRPEYQLEIVAVDGGEPSLSGSTTLKIGVMNRNNKLPFFRPTTQRAQVTEDTEAGTQIFQLSAFDEDVEDVDSLEYSVMFPIVAIDKDGQQVPDQEKFMSLFFVDPKTGAVVLTDTLDRNSVATISLSVKVTDTSADPPQDGIGNLVITIIDVNDFAPEFPPPWTPELKIIEISVKEEKPVGSEVHKFTATDKDSNIARFEISPPNRYFDIDKGSGKLIVKEMFDFEELEQKRITFDLKVYDNGIPEKSAEAVVMVTVENANDQSPVFEEQMYSVTVPENSGLGTPIVKVSATDLDDDEFGIVTYKLEGTYQEGFQISHDDGTISVVNSDLLDREKMDNLILQVVAVDSAPSESKKSSTVPVNITITDTNDNPPRFLQKQYSATIVDNIPFYPEASPIAQVTATDLDIGRNAELFYTIVAGNDQDLFRIGNLTGILYPNQSFLGQKGQQFQLVIEVTDEAGEGVWPTPEQCEVRITVESVNTHKPVWNPPPPLNETILVREESDMTPVFLRVQATDRDGNDNENGRISYFLKVNNINMLETDEFKIDQTSGELRSKGKLDREERDHYELVIVARDHGTPVAFETLRFLNIVVEDIDDNSPRFPPSLTSANNVLKFTVEEEEAAGFVVGRVEAVDPDAGRFGDVFYYIVKGNEGSWFSIAKSQGTIYTNKVLDREEEDGYTLYVKASNDPSLICEAKHCNIEMTEGDDQDGSIVKIQIDIQDINDNDLQFESTEFFVGIPFDASVGDLILDATAVDLDLDANGKVTYSIKSSNLFKQGQTQTAGSLVPSPFSMTQSGRIILEYPVAEFNQQRFEIDIEAKESRSIHRAKATVNLWVFEPAQQIKMIINKDPMMVNKEKETIIAELKNVTQKIVVIDDIRYHVSAASGLRRDMTDMYIHVVDGDTNEIVHPEEVVKVVDANYDHLVQYYDDVGIHQVVPAEVKSEEVVFDSNLAALIALALVLFVGFITFFVVMCCLRYWVMSTSNRPMKLQESPRAMKAHSVVDDGGVGGTDNPLWIDQKYKAYEEQELTMTVFSDQDNSVISGNGGSGNSQSRRGSVSQSHLETQSNAYATINKLPMAPASRRSLFNGSLDLVDGERDYATLDKSARSPLGPVVPGVTSTPISSTLPRRQQAGHSPPDTRGSNFFLNRDGEPQLVGNLS